MKTVRKVFSGGLTAAPEWVPLVSAAARLFPCTRRDPLTPAQLLQTLWALEPTEVEAGFAALGADAAEVLGALDLGRPRAADARPPARPVLAPPVRQAAEVAVAIDGGGFTPAMRLFGALVTLGYGLPGGATADQHARNRFWERVRGEGRGADGPGMDRDLVAAAAGGPLPMVVPRDEVTGRVVEILCQLRGRVVALVGPEGVGKGSVVNALAWRIAQGRVAWPVRLLRPVRPPVAVEADGTRLRERLLGWLEEGRRTRTVPVVREHALSLLVREDAAALVRLLLECQEVGRPLVLLASDGLLTHLAGKWPEAVEGVERVVVEEPDAAFVRRVVALGAARLEEARRVTIPESAREEAIALTNRVVRHQFQPGKSLRFLDGGVAHLLARDHGVGAMTPQVVREVVAAETGIPLDHLDPSHRGLPNLESDLRRRVVGQEGAITAVAKVMRVVKGQYDREPRRPDGVFLFTGPSGVGKTELAESLAGVLFGSRWKRHLICKHMSEYSEATSVAKLGSAPPGYVGHLETRTLVDEIRERPASLLLLDEMDKAHPEVHQLFLQVFDDGTFTDARGRTAHFAEVTVVMTANLFDDTDTKVGFVENDRVEEGEELDQIAALREVFPKEFLSRVDEVALFRPLAVADLEEILRRRLVPDLQGRLATQDGVTLKVEEPVLHWLATHAHSPRFGARHLDRAFQDHVTEPLVAQLHRQKARGARAVRVSLGRRGPVLRWHGGDG